MYYSPFHTFFGLKYPPHPSDANYLFGNQLIEGMIDSKNTCSIVVDWNLQGDHAELADKKAAGAMGSDATVTFNPTFSPKLYVQKQRSKYIELQETEPYIVLAQK